jgi:hypothetical protein
MPCEKTKQNSTCGMIMPCVQIDIKKFWLHFDNVECAPYLRGIFFFFFKVMRNVNRMRLWDEKMAQHGWKGGIALDKLKWVRGEEWGCDATLLVLLAFRPPSSSSHHLIPSYLHIPWHIRLAWNLLKPFGFDLLTKCTLIKMKLRFSVNCRLLKSKALIPTSPTMVHNPTTDNHSQHNSKSSQDFWKEKLNDTLEQHLPPLWLTTQP